MMIRKYISSAKFWDVILNTYTVGAIMSISTILSLFLFGFAININNQILILISGIWLFSLIIITAIVNTLEVYISHEKD